MNMIAGLIRERQLPDLLTMKDGTVVTEENWEKRRQELLEIMGENLYGKMPEYVGTTTWHELSEEVNAAGKACTRKVEITFPTPDGKTFTFPVSVTIPFTARDASPKPAFVLVSFGYPKYYPMEELVDHDVIVAEMVMDHVALDREDRYEELLAKHFYPSGKRTPNGIGKIGMWAFAASRVLDYLLSLDNVDSAHVGVVGHSLLGKTALWAGANDSRVTHVISNNSGCAGAALTRKKEGETFPIIYDRFSYWFCENMQQLSLSVEKMEHSTFDQHFLLAASAPRKVYVSSAEEDSWADPISEYLSCVAASQAWEILGMPGFIHPDKLPKIHERFAEGNVGYHLRPGTHFLSRYDWARFCEFLKT